MFCYIDHNKLRFSYFFHQKIIAVVSSLFWDIGKHKSPSAYTLLETAKEKQRDVPCTSIGGGLVAISDNQILILAETS